MKNLSTPPHCWKNQAAGSRFGGTQRGTECVTLHHALKLDIRGEEVGAVTLADRELSATAYANALSTC